MGVLRTLLVLVCLLALSASAFAQPRRSQRDTFLDNWAAAEIGKGLGQGIASAISSAVEYTNASRNFSQDIETARRRFWSAYPSGAGRAQAEAEFARQLGLKDLHYLIISIPEGVSGVRANVLNAMGSVDGGIRSPAKPEFEDWINAIRANLGVKRKGDMVIPSPASLERAMQATSKEYQAYKETRDWAEFDAAGREPEWINSPSGYVQMLLQRYAKKDRPKAKELYMGMMEVFGEQHVLQVAEKVRQAPKTKSGDVANVERLGLIEHRTRIRTEGGRESIEANNDPVPDGLTPVISNNPYRVFRTLLCTGDSRRFLLGLIHSQQQAENWLQANRSYTKWTTAYNEKTVLTAAARIVTATKRMEDSAIRDPKSLGVGFNDPYLAFQDILAKNDSRGHVQAILAFSQDLVSGGDISAAYQKLVSTHGEQKLLNAALKVTELWETPYQLRPSQFARLSRHSLGATDYDLLMTFLKGGGASVPTSDSDVLDNPVFIAWSNFRPGDRVTYLHRSLPQQGQRPAPDEMSIESTTTLKSLGPDQVLTVISEKIIRGRTVTPSSRGGTHQGYPAKARKEWFEKAFSSKNYLLARIVLENSKQLGADRLAVAGRELNTRRYKLEPYRNSVHTVWVSDEVPGGIVRILEERTVGRSTLINETMLLSFDGTRVHQDTARSVTAPVLPKSNPSILGQNQDSFTPGSYLTTERASVRSGPRPSFEVVAEIPENTKVQVVDSDADWLKVQSKHGKPPGYIPARSARRSEDQPQAGDAPPPLSKAKARLSK